MPRKNKLSKIIYYDHFAPWMPFKCEWDVELYIWDNLYKIEKGLIRLERQFSVDGKRMDILARDIRGSLVLIEVKMCILSYVLPQLWEYAKILKKIGIKNIRMVAAGKNINKKTKALLEKNNIEVWLLQ